MNPGGYYPDLLPDEFRSILSERPLAVLPWGALEFHGPHLPLGLDGLVADAFAARLVERTGGILFPTTWWAVTTLPHPLSVQIPAPVVRALFDALLAQLADIGFRQVAVVSGHYAHPHELLLMDAASAATARGLPVLAAPPLALLGDPARLDHAARWETSQLLAVRPDLVRLERLDAQIGADSPSTHLLETAVLGEDPRSTATPAAGRQIVAQALDAWERALATLTPEWLDGFYRRRRAEYDEFVQRYLLDDDWDAALERWWSERTAHPQTRDGE